jgi:hypothetical protein
MKRIFVLLLLTLFVGSVFAQAQKEKKAIETKLVKIDKSRGAAADPNIKQAKPVDDKVLAEKPRGDVYGANYCDVVIENHTGYTIDIYVDFKYRGTINAYEAKVTWAIPGATRLYAKSIGGTASWGPVNVDCQYQYTWRLWD